LAWVWLFVSESIPFLSWFLFRDGLASNAGEEIPFAARFFVFEDGFLGVGFSYMASRLTMFSSRTLLTMKDIIYHNRVGRRFEKGFMMDANGLLWENGFSFGNENDQINVSIRENLTL
jgi:hypothetical protein